MDSIGDGTMATFSEHGSQSAVEGDEPSILSKHELVIGYLICRVQPNGSYINHIPIPA